MIQPTEPRQVTENLQAINAQLSEELKSLRAAQSREGPQAAMMAEAASTAEAAALATTAAEEAMQYAGTLQDALTSARTAFKEQGDALQGAFDRNATLTLAFDGEDAARGRRTARSTPSEPEHDAAMAQVVALNLEF